jgi:hypothetical protein
MGTRYGILVLGLAALFLASADAAGKPTPKQIAQLIEQLGSNSYEEREQATKKLAEIGLPALDALQKAASKGDPEIRKRAEELINRLNEHIRRTQPARQPNVPKPIQPGQLIPPIGGGAVPAVPVPAVQIMANAAIALGMGGPNQPTAIVLKDGKPPTVPTCYSGSFRIRALPGGKPRVRVSADLLVLSVETRAEPRLQLQNLKTVKITKAVDDQEQRLDQVVIPAGWPAPQGVGPNGVIQGAPGFGIANLAQLNSPTQVVQVYLKKAVKDSRTLKELCGTLTAQTLLAPETLITVENIRKAAGKTFKGKDGSTLKVADVKSDESEIILKVKIDSPAGAGPLAPQIQIQIMPGIPQVPIPLPPPPPPGGGIFQIQPQPVPAAQVQIRQFQFGGFVPNGGGAEGGLKLLDDKGKVIPQTQSGTEVHMAAGGPPDITYTLGYKLQKGQVPAKLVYTAGRSITFDIPFTLKDVPVK